MNDWMGGRWLIDRAIAFETPYGPGIDVNKSGFPTTILNTEGWSATAMPAEDAPPPCEARRFYEGAWEVCAVYRGHETDGVPHIGRNGEDDEEVSRVTGEPLLPVVIVRVDRVDVGRIEEVE